jgi:hypothetical protein
MKKSVFWTAIVLFTITMPHPGQANIQAIPSAIFIHANEPMCGIEADSIPFAKVIVYRPENQLSRKYKVSSNLNGSISLKRKEIATMDAFTNTFEVSVSAAAHKSARFSFPLSKNQVHYFRLQDRNNYAGFTPFLEVVEVTEATYNREILDREGVKIR